MDDNKLEKKVSMYTKLFRNALYKEYIVNAESLSKRYLNQITELYQSPKFQEYEKYQSLNREKVFAIIAMCLVLKEENYSNEEIYTFVNVAFGKAKNAYKVIITAIDLLPCAYRIVEKWHENDYNSRMKDGSVYFDSYVKEEGKIEYNVTKCKYADAFAYYGIRELTKIFCDTDINAYINLKKHVNFQRYSDLSSGESCHDVITKK